MFFDTHSHVSHGRFDGDRNAMFARAATTGITTMIDVGTDIPTSQRACATALEVPSVYAAIGVHPHEADGFEADRDLDMLRELAQQPKVVAIGEIGLDFYRNHSSRDAQERVMHHQLSLACELKLPVILHLRSSANGGEDDCNAYSGALEALSHYRGEIRGVSHCFSATADVALAMCELGFYVSFAGNVTYPNAHALHAAAKQVPADRLLVETDCPFLAPQVHRGKRNEPAFVRDTARFVADLRGVDLNVLAAQTTTNARALFGL